MLKQRKLKFIVTEEVRKLGASHLKARKLKARKQRLSASNLKAVRCEVWKLGSEAEKLGASHQKARMKED